MSEVSVTLDEEEGQLKEEETKEDVEDVFESPESPEVSCSNDEIKNETEEIESKVKEFEITNESTDGKNFDVELDFEGEQASDKEDGEIPGEKLPDEEKGELEEGEDGELTEGDDELEEGELEESGPAAKTPTRQVCRFFNRGKCTFGQVCRFLHLNNNYGRGNYNMFQNNNDRYPNNGGPWPPASDPAMVNPRSGGRQDFFVPPFVPPPVPQPSPLESAWERGLLNAKKLVKKAHIRKGSSPDFEEKRLNLSLSQDLPENDKENEKKKGDRQNFYKYDAEPPNWKRHSFDNFEIRYTNRDFLDVPYREREKGSPPSNRRDNYPDRGEKMSKRGGRQWDNDRFGALPRLRAEEWYDPYRRSKSPKGRRSRSRSGSYSTVSSYSYSDRSSVSYSRSSSGSSCDSSRSPSPLSRRKSPHDGISSPKRSDSRLLTRRKPGGRSSSSRSLSMDSISESGNSSTASVGGSKPHLSIMSKKDDDKPEDEIRAKKLFQQLQYLKEKKDSKLGTNREEDPDDPLNDIMPSQQSSMPAFPSLQHLLPSTDKKESNKGPHAQKQQIKLTLLNKSQTNKFASLQKDVDPAKPKQLNDESKFSGGFHPGTKRPLSPPSPTAPAPSAAPKKSASSRRDELLKQLKAVEDAIARKRAKFC
ncbi:zinc finger CCCH domain-containing protein 18 isoform X2 [Parasteatoda tepidariorum]|uniref:zinc finger CCCH domain-containing protein 18 isoform X2 n=1 Tax=Parasteatoda tepidariorum TaxID=114398 RepID=UPI00077FD3DD|nr:zinc finger CCCH domain-containing protein 18 isoform X2 [Parasteatoda tepidariorum]